MFKRRPVYRFDPLLRSDDNSLTDAISEFAQRLAEDEAKFRGRIRKRKTADQEKFNLAVECLIVNFAAVRMWSPRAMIAVPLSNKILRGRPRYRPEVYGKHFRDIIYVMESLGLIAIVTKGFNVREWNRSTPTTIRPTAKLIAHFPALIKCRHFDNWLSRVEEPEVVVLKDREGELIDYKETKNTRRWRTELQAINKFIEAAPISLTRLPELVDENGFAVPALTKSLRRIWNNSDWNQGARLYGTAWQTAVNQIKQKHALITHYFESNKGLTFMRIESDILVASLLRLMKRGITALPIHDAVLVQKRFAHAAKKTLEEESKRRIGTTIPADITTSSK